MMNCCSRFLVRRLMAILSDQPHGLALALDAQVIAVVLDFVEPVVADGNGFGGRWQAELERVGQSGDSAGSARRSPLVLGQLFRDLLAVQRVEGLAELAQFRACIFRIGFPCSLLPSA